MRETLVRELHHIIKSANLTAIYVTHDQQEAFVIADRIAIMHQGTIAQIDTPQNIYYRPKSRFVVEFLGLQNIVTADCRLVMQLLDGQPNSDSYLVHPKGIFLVDEGISANVVEITFSGDRTQLLVDVPQCGTWRFSVYDPAIRLEVGQQVFLNVDPQFIVPLES